MKLVNELTTRFWFAKQKKVFDTLSIQDLDKKIEDKFEQDCEAKELGYVTFVWSRDSKGGFTLLDGVVRDTLKSLIAEMKTERQTKLAEANKTYEAPSDPGVKYCPPPPPRAPQKPPPSLRSGLYYCDFDMTGMIFA